MTPSAIKSEHQTLEKIHAVLDLPKHRSGLTARQICDATGLAIGRVQEVLKKSECVLKRAAPRSQKWISEYADLEGWTPSLKTQYPMGVVSSVIRYVEKEQDKHFIAMPDRRFIGQCKAVDAAIKRVIPSKQTSASSPKK